jgi:hypothetical protein
MSSPWRKSIPASERASLHVLPLLAALAWLAASAGTLFLLVQAGGDRTTMLIIAGLVLIGLALSWRQGRKFIALLREGAARLVLREAPPAIGGRLKAFVRLPRNAAQASQVTAELLCMRDADGDRDALNPFSARKVWSLQHELPVQREGGAGVAALDFEIPASCPPSGKWDSGKDDDSGEDHTIGWQLRVSAGAGSDLVEHRFDLEVLRPRAPQAAQAPIEWLRDFAALALIVANLIPVYMVLRGRADVASLAYLYWAENLVIAGYMFLRVIFAARGDVGDKIGGVLFFALWLGAVSIFLGRVLIAILLNPPRDWDSQSTSMANWGARILGTIGTHIVEAGLVIAVLALVASHGIGFVQNYIRNGQYLQARVNQEIALVMKRGFLTFGAISVIAGLAPLGSPKYLLAALVLAKTGFEIWRYAHEQRTAVADAGRSIITA